MNSFVMVVAFAAVVTGVIWRRLSGASAHSTVGQASTFVQ